MIDDTETDFCDRLPGQHTGRMSLELQAKEAAEWQERIDKLQSEIRRLIKLNHHLREVAVMAITERVPSDSKPTNFHNPESEDTPPHNPVLGPIVGTATVKHQTSCPAATAPTVPPEVGKRYVCRNGVVTPLMKSDTLTGRNQPYYFCDIDGTTTYWGHDGRGYVGRQDDLIAEYHEPEPSPPAESPDVSGEIRGLKYALQWIDAKRAGNPKLKVAAWEMLNDMQVHFEAAIARLESGEAISSTSQTDAPAESPDDWVVLTDPKHIVRACDLVSCDGVLWRAPNDSLGNPISDYSALQFRCRRKDLPVVPDDNPLPQPWNPMIGTPSVETALRQFVEWHDMDHEEMKGSEVQAAYDKLIADAKAALQADADKPRMRTIELSEHRYNHSNKMTVWSSRLLSDMYTTGRTAVVDVPD